MTYDSSLLRKIKDPKLRISLALLREAAEIIWAPYAPRIVRDYTDHSIQHKERLTFFATKLLESNDGRPLSEEETYLLLAGIYLHDIGLQCDVANFPEIVEEAGRLGAEFDVEFTTKTAIDYTIDEQKNIRNNHQYLTAAWIIHSRRHPYETVLGRGTRTVPDDLIEDLMDICLYHSRLPIFACPPTFKFDPNQRKQLVAALLRLSDELDVNDRRVGIESIRNLMLTPYNSVLWWLNNRIDIEIGDYNKIRLLIRLHPEDVKQKGDIFRLFIMEFSTKLLPLIMILRQNDIPIEIDTSSDIVEDKYIKRVPADINYYLTDLSNLRLKSATCYEKAIEVIDFLFITALEEERDYLLNKLKGFQKLPPFDDDIRTYFKAELPVTFPDGKTGTYRVIRLFAIPCG